MHFTTLLNNAIHFCKTTIKKMRLLKPHFLYKKTTSTAHNRTKKWAIFLQHFGHQQ